MAECQNCGGFVTDDYARVFGDNQNDVHDCRQCPTEREIRDAEDEEGDQVLLRDVMTDREEGTTARADAAGEGDAGRRSAEAPGSGGGSTDRPNAGGGEVSDGLGLSRLRSVLGMGAK